MLKRLGLTACAALLGWGGPVAADDAEVAHPVEQTEAEQTEAVQIFSADLQRWAPMGSAWSDQALAELAAALLDAPSHGLPPLDPYAAMLLDPEVSRAARGDLAGPLFFRLAGWLSYGLLDADTHRARRLTDTDVAPLAEHLDAALSDGSVADALAQITPTAGNYEALRLEMLRMLVLRPIWPQIEPGPALAVGAQGARVDQLRARLSAENLLSTDWREGDPFDVRLETAVRRYQGRVNLAPNGQLDRSTLQQLNITPEQRIEQLRINLEQRRWRTRTPGRRHIWVNLADFRLEAWEEGRLARVHQVMVGAQASSTPEFSDEMEYLVLNPWWNVPAGLARSRFRAIRRNPGVAVAMGYRVYASGYPVSAYEIDWDRWSSGWNYRIAQAPGPRNPMGEVKFMFPNRHNIYIHDTTERDRFVRTRRDFSAGCIRVQDPFDLAEWVLAEQPDWPRERIDEIVAGTAPTTVRLDEHIPVHIAYWTVVGDADGRVRYLHDLYRRDGELVSAYAAAYETLRGAIPQSWPAPAAQLATIGEALRQPGTTPSGFRRPNQ